MAHKAVTPYSEAKASWFLIDMKGMIFLLFNEFVVETYGFGIWEDMLANIQPVSEGIYTAGATYADREFMALLSDLTDKLDLVCQDILIAFGRYMFPKLAAKYSFFLKDHDCLKTFLLTVDRIIHVEVKKLDPEAQLPELTYQEPSENQLIIYYRSERRLCYLAEGLIEGAARYFKTRLKIRHPVCMHKGAEACRLEVVLLDD